MSKSLRDSKPNESLFFSRLRRQWCYSLYHRIYSCVALVRTLQTLQFRNKKRKRAAFFFWLEWRHSILSSLSLQYPNRNVSVTAAEPTDMHVGLARNLSQIQAKRNDHPGSVVNNPFHTLSHTLRFRLSSRPLRRKKTRYTSIATGTYLLTGSELLPATPVKFRQSLSESFSPVVASGRIATPVMQRPPYRTRGIHPPEDIEPPRVYKRPRPETRKDPPVGRTFQSDANLGKTKPNNKKITFNTQKRTYSARRDEL